MHSIEACAFSWNSPASLEDVDAAGAHEADNGGFADVDLPAVGDGAEDDGQNLGKDAEPRRLETGGAGGFDGLHHALVNLLDGLGCELAHEADGSEADDPDAGHGTRAEDGHEEKPTHHGVDGARSDQDQAANEPGFHVDGGVPGGQKDRGQFHDDRGRGAPGGEVDDIQLIIRLFFYKRITAEHFGFAQCKPTTLE